MIVGLGSLLTVGYATRRGVDAEEASQRRRPAMGVFMALFAPVAVGMLVSVDWNAGGLGAAAAMGIAVGSAVGVVAGFGWIGWRHRRTAGPA